MKSLHGITLFLLAVLTGLIGFRITAIDGHSQERTTYLHKRLVDLENKSAIARIQLDALIGLRNIEKKRETTLENVIGLCTECHDWARPHKSISPDLLGKLLDRIKDTKD